MPYSSSALERFTYCPLSWSLAKAGVASEGEAAAAGHAKHSAKGRLLTLWDALRRIYTHSFDSAMLFTMIASSAAILAIDVALLDPLQPVGLFLLVLSLLCLLAALAFLLRAVQARRRGEDLRLEAGIFEGDLTYSDLDRPAELLTAPKYELSGKPDYVVRREGRLIPVEVKTGKSPERPYDSHVVQCAAYCLLVQEAYGERPPYGVIRYEDRAFEVPFDANAERQVLVTLLRMRLAEATGEVHRNHRIRSRCAGCSRRDACPERLA